MRVCHVTDTLPGYHRIWGGAERATVRLVEALSRGGVENHVCSMPPEKGVDEGFHFHPLRTADSLFGGRAAAAIRKVKRVWYPRDAVAAGDFRRVLKSVRPDVVHFHNINVLSLSLVEAAKRLAFPSVMGIYDYWLFCPKSTLIDGKNRPCRESQGAACVSCVDPPSMRGLHSFFMRRRGKIFGRSIAGVDAFAVLSRSSAAVLERCGIERERIFTIRQIFPYRSFDPVGFDGIERYSILLVGWVQHRKGAHVLIDAMPRIVREFPGARLDIVGELVERDYLERLRASIESHGLAGSVTIHGRVGEKRLQDLFRKAHVVAVAEQWENMSPVVLLEAMAKGKVIVAGRIGGIPEFLEDGVSGYLAAFDDPGDFAQKVVQVFGRADLGERLGAAARAEVERMFREETIVGEYLELYRRLV